MYNDNNNMRRPVTYTRNLLGRLEATLAQISSNDLEKKRNYQK